LQMIKFHSSSWLSKIPLCGITSNLCIYLEEWNLIKLWFSNI
jgi:hypothetical protein